MASSLSEAPCETQDTAHFAPQPRANTFLRLVEPDTQPTATLQAPEISSALERAGAEVGFLTWRFISRSLRWLDGRQDTVNALGRAAGTSTRSQPATRFSAEPARGAATEASADPTRPVLANGRRVDFLRDVAPLAPQPVPSAFDAQRPVSGESSRFVAHAQPVEQPGARRAASPESHNVLHEQRDVRETPRTSRGTFPKAYELAAETIPPLVTLALRNWIKPSWAQAAETGCSVAINTARVFQDGQPRNAQPRSPLTILASATFAVASGVATISSSGLVGLAATSPWIVTLIGGVLLLAIIWRAMEGRGSSGAFSGLGGGALAMS